MKHKGIKETRKLFNTGKRYVLLATRITNKKTRRRLIALVEQIKHKGIKKTRRRHVASATQIKHKASKGTL